MSPRDNGRVSSQKCQWSGLFTKVSMVGSLHKSVNGRVSSQKWQWSGLSTKVSMVGSLHKGSFTTGLLKVQSWVQYSLLCTMTHCLKSFPEVGAVITNLLMILNFTSLQLHLTSIHWLRKLSSVLTLSGDGWLMERLKLNDAKTEALFGWIS